MLPRLPSRWEEASCPCPKNPAPAFSHSAAGGHSGLADRVGLSPSIIKNPGYVPRVITIRLKLIDCTAPLAVRVLYEFCDWCSVQFKLVERHAVHAVMNVQWTAGARHETLFNPAATDLNHNKLLDCQLTMKIGQRRRPCFLTRRRSGAERNLVYYIQ